MVSKLKFLYSICNAFMCCMSDSLSNVYIGMLKEIRYMEIVQRVSWVGCLFISSRCNLSFKITWKKLFMWICAVHFARDFVQVYFYFSESQNHRESQTYLADVWLISWLNLQILIENTYDILEPVLDCLFCIISISI